MSKIAQAFARGKAFIPFITCGDPDLETTAAAVRAAVENGADLIELGIPFSDPTAEGPVIQGANLRALQDGVTTDQMCIRDRAAIDVACISQTKAICCVLTVMKYIRSGSVDGNRTGIRCRVRVLLAHMELERFKFVIRHSCVPFCSMIYFARQNR